MFIPLSKPFPHKHTDGATTPAKLSNYAGGIGLKKNEVIKEHHLCMPDYLKQSTLANNEGGRGGEGLNMV
jgi:hypothetical protein